MINTTQLSPKVPEIRELLNHVSTKAFAKLEQTGSPIAKKILTYVEKQENQSIPKTEQTAFHCFFYDIAILTSQFFKSAALDAPDFFVLQRNRINTVVHYATHSYVEYRKLGIPAELLKTRGSLGEASTLRKLIEECTQDHEYHQTVKYLLPTLVLAQESEVSKKDKINGLAKNLTLQYSNKLRELYQDTNPKNPPDAALLSAKAGCLALVELAPTLHDWQKQFQNLDLHTLRCPTGLSDDLFNQLGYRSREIIALRKFVDNEQFFIEDSLVRDLLPQLGRAGRRLDYLQDACIAEVLHYNDPDSIKRLATLPKDYLSAKIEEVTAILAVEFGLAELIAEMEKMARESWNRIEQRQNGDEQEENFEETPLEEEESPPPLTELSREPQEKEEDYRESDPRSVEQGQSDHQPIDMELEKKNYRRLMGRIVTKTNELFFPNITAVFDRNNASKLILSIAQKAVINRSPLNYELTKVNRLLGHFSEKIPHSTESWQKIVSTLALVAYRVEYLDNDSSSRILTHKLSAKERLSPDEVLGILASFEAQSSAWHRKAELVLWQYREHLHDLDAADNSPEGETSASIYSNNLSQQ